MRVLIGRPSPGNEATAAAVRALGCEAVVLPLFDLVAVPWSPPDPAGIDRVVMTSANAARLGGDGLSRYYRLPLLAVGTTTAAAARAAGFRQVECGDGDAASLANRIVGRVLHLTGRDHRALPATDVVTRIVYAADLREMPGLPPVDVALVHSARAGRRVAELATDRASVAIVAISAAAARSVASGWASVIVTGAPNDAAMLASLRDLCEAGRDPAQDQMV